MIIAIFLTLAGIFTFFIIINLLLNSSIKKNPFRSGVGNKKDSFCSSVYTALSSMSDDSGSSNSSGGHSSGFHGGSSDGGGSHHSCSSHSCSSHSCGGHSCGGGH